MNTANRLLEAIKNFPEPVLAEVVDFAEFLRQKLPHGESAAADEPLKAIAGGLENSTTFNDDPMTLQARLRDEWN